MEKRTMGKTGMEVSVLGFGGAEIGYEGATAETVKRLLDDALDAGLNVIDTAECYMNSEELIGEAASGRRNEFYLFTKCGHGPGPSIADWSEKGLLSSIERSLKRLRTDQVDLIQLHSCSEAEFRKGIVIEALQKARSKGYTQFIGYSGDGSAARYAIECGAFDTLQTSINIADQEALELTLPLAITREMGVIAKRPIANAAWRTGKKPESDYHHAYWNRLQQLQYDFLKKPLEESVGIAMRFTLSVPGVHTMIVGTKKPGRWRENARLLEQGALSPADFEAIRQRWNEIKGPDWTGQT
jgi:aryl-alcohol dehydrogenase-like predicted oxidoreductase